MIHESQRDRPNTPPDRPFPWRCTNCLEEEVRPQTIRHLVELRHDGRLHKLDIPELTVPVCSACGKLVFTDAADDQVLEALRRHLRLLTPQQIRSERLALGLKKKELARLMGVAAATISRWETGALVQSRAMDNYLRVYFTVPHARNVLMRLALELSLGTPEVRDAGPDEGDRNAATLNRFQQYFPNLKDPEKAWRWHTAFQVTPGVN